MMSRFHPASLVDPHDHPQELLDFFELDAQDRCLIGKPVFQSLDLRDRPFVHLADDLIIDYIVYTTTDVAAHVLDPNSTESIRSSLLILSDRMHSKYGGFDRFVWNVVQRSRTRTPTILIALVYMRRAKVNMDVPPLDWVLHRLFLGALILATTVRYIFFFRSLILLSSSCLPLQYTLDFPHTNRDWSGITGIFGRRDIGKMEFEMFEVLGMRLSVTQEELRQLCLEILAEYTTELAHLTPPTHPRSSRVQEPPLALT